MPDLPQAQSLPTDGELMERLQGGDLEALGHLFDRHHRALYNFCLRMTGERPLSEDVVQEVFCRVLRYCHSFRPARAFRPWIFGVARHVLYDRQGERPDERSLDSAEEAFAIQPSAPPQHEAMERAERHRQLRSALGALPRDKREVLVLARFHGLRYEQIGEVLGCSTGAVKVRVHRALDQLRRLFLRRSARHVSREATS